MLALMFPIFLLYDVIMLGELKNLHQKKQKKFKLFEKASFLKNKLCLGKQSKRLKLYVYGTKIN